MSRSTARRFKGAIYQQLARIGKALASPRRLEFVDLLAQSQHTAERLARKTGQSVANTSQHLQALRRARLVEAEKRGLHVSYRLADDVAQFYRALRLLGEARLTEIRRLTQDFLSSRGILEPVDREALISRVKRGEVAVVDVRPAEEYEAGHIPGAVSVPLRELERRLAALPTDREIGPRTVTSTPNRPRQLQHRQSQPANAR